MKREFSRVSALACGVLALCLLVPLGGDTAQPNEPAATPEGKTTASGVTTEDMTAEHEAELRAYLAPRLNRSDEGLVEKVDADGGISMDLRGRFQNVVLARVAADGRVEVGCFSELEAAMLFLKFETLPLSDHETAAE
jgi:hypothetical protein